MIKSPWRYLIIVYLVFSLRLGANPFFPQRGKNI